MSKAKPRCAVCDRPDVDAVNADLGRMTLREVSARHKIPRETLRRHSLHRASPARVAEVIDLVPGRFQALPAARRLKKGQMLASVIDRIALLDGIVASAERDLADPALGLRERHLILRSLVQVWREIRGYLELASRVGALDAQESQGEEVQTIADVRRLLSELQREVDAAEG